MASYRVSGMSTAQVKELQSALGVKADGAWGRQSQAALEAAYGKNAGARSVYQAGGGSSTYGKTGGFTGGVNTYGNGSYGGKYLGSNNNNAYASMENAPGSAGYESGTRIDLATGRVTAGVLPLGTRFTASGGALADAQGVPNSSGIFAYAKGRTPGYVEHVSGYKGAGYTDAKGNYYDANGNFLREDGYFYEPGAALSKNGMFQDTGGGMGSAAHGLYGTFGDPRKGEADNLMYVRAGNYGRAPGTPLGFFGGGGGSAADYAAYASPSASGYAPQQADTGYQASDAQAQTQTQAQAQAQTTGSRNEEYEALFERELRRYLELLASGYGI